MNITPTKKWIETSECYMYCMESMRHHSDCYDFSDEAASTMFSYESTGCPVLRYNERNGKGLYNGFAVGKHWMDVLLADWKDDIRNGLLSKYEILSDPKIPNKLKQIVQNEFISGRHCLL